MVRWHLIDAPRENPRRSDKSCNQQSKGEDDYEKSNDEDDYHARKPPRCPKS